MFGVNAGRRLRPDQRGVSPVIGTILILVIMIFSMAGILAWGVPAIQGLQDRAEFQHTLTQFLQMDAQVRNLRDPQNTRVITLSLSQGQLVFEPGERWVITGTRDDDYDGFYLTGWETGNPGKVGIAGVTLGSEVVSVDVVNGGSINNRFTCTGCSTVNVGDAVNPALLTRDVVRITVKASGTVVAESWILNAGRISYHQSELHELNRLHFSMGAVFSQQNNAFFVEEAPTIKEPDYDIDPEDTNLFIRALQLNGTAISTFGEGRRPVIFNLLDNYGASRGRPSFDPATAVRIQVHGLLEIPFCNYLLQRGNWDPDPDCPSSGTAGDVNVLYVRPPDAEHVVPTTPESLVFDLSHAVVTTTVRTQ